MSGFIKYYDKDFSSLKQDLINYVKSHFNNPGIDFSYASPANIFLDMAAYVGDLLSFYLDTQIQENFISYATQDRSVYALSYAMGYSPSPVKASNVILDVYMLLPSTGSPSFLPDWRYACIINKNAIIGSVSNPSITFVTTDIVDFSYSSSFDPTTISVYQYYSGSNNPQYYLLKKSVRAISGTIKTQTFSFGNPVPYQKVYINDDSIVNIISAVDSDGNNWYKVDYLAQNFVITSILNNPDNNPSYYDEPRDAINLLKYVRAYRRYTGRYINKDQYQIQFGSGIYSYYSQSIVPNPYTIGIGAVNGSGRMNISFDPRNFIYTDEYGVAPSNTDITFTYISSYGFDSNLPTDDIKNIISINVNNFNYGIDSGSLNYVISSIQFNNSQAATGGGPSDDVEDIKNKAISYLFSQNRAVTKEDYEIRALSMSPEFGLVSKAYATCKTINNKKCIFLYCLSEDANGNFVTLSPVIRRNLINYLNQYKILTDTVVISDPYIINIQIYFEIYVEHSFNSYEVLYDCISFLKSYFDNSNMAINKPIIIYDIISSMSSIKGVRNINNFQIKNVYGGNYSSFSYDIDLATKDEIIYPSLDPMIFEVKYPDVDILGKVLN
ncbi:MAG: hypothetical protein IRZ03_15690 [Acidobacterium ailaaui]|nr:hypothetical protein [Pseudacidobacterium ailaaui]